MFLFRDYNSDADFADPEETTLLTPGVRGVPNYISNDDYFGSSVAVDGSTLYVGMTGSAAGGTAAGSVIVLTDRNADGNYTLPSEVRWINDGTHGISLDAGDRFGSSISVTAPKLFVGANHDDAGGTNFGAVYVLEDKNADGDYADPGENVKIDATTTPGVGSNGLFGSPIFSHNGRLYAGRPLSDAGAIDTGDVVVFDFSFDADIAPSDMQGLSDGQITVNADPITFDNTSASSPTAVTFVYDRVAPTVGTPTLTPNFGGSTVTVTDSDATATAMRYRVIDAGTACDAAAMQSGTTPYTEGTGLVLNNPADNGRKVCFSSTDPAGNAGFAASPPLAIATALSASIGAIVPALPAKSKTVTISAVPDGATAAYAITGNTGCTASGFGTGTALTLASNAATVTLNAESANGMHVCFKLSKTGFADSFGISPVIRGIDTTAPTMTVDPVSGGFVGSNEENTNTDVSGSYAGDIADVSFTASDGNAGTSDVVKYVTDFRRLLRVKLSDDTLGIDFANSVRYFGRGLAVSGSKMYISTGEDDNSDGIARGAVYILEDTNADGDYADTGEFAVINSATPGLSLPDYTNFGRDIAVSGDTLFVGAPAYDTHGTNRGAVYILDDDNADGSYAGSGEVQIIDNRYGGILLSDGDSFGNTVTVDGNMLLVGAPLDDDGGTDTGAVYVFTDTDNDGSYTDTPGSTARKISANTAGVTLAAGDRFGTALAARDGVVYIGAPGDDTGGFERGAVHILEDRDNDGDYDGAGEHRVIKHGIDGLTLADSMRLGDSLATDGSKLFVGTPAAASETNPFIIGKGGFFVFEDKNDDGDFGDSGERVRVKGSALGSGFADGDAFGRTIAVGGSLLAVSAPASDIGGDNRGAVYLFDLSFATKLTPEELRGLAEGTIIVTAGPRDISGNVGAAAGSFVYDTAPPIISEPLFGVLAGARTVRAVDNDGNPTVMRYKIITDDAGCDKGTMASGTTAYTEGDTLTLSADDAGKRVCFASTDQSDNTGYRQSALITTVPPLTATLSSFTPTGSAPRKSLTVTAATDGATVSYNKITAATCDATSFGNTGTAVSFTNGIGIVSVYAVSDNDKYLCFRITKAEHPTVFTRSEQITGISPFMPAFTPADGALTNSTSAVSIAFSEGLYADATGTAFTNTTIDGIITLKQNNADGTAIPFDATVSGTTVTVTPTSAFSEGAVYVAVSGNWYYGPGSTKSAGVADSARFTVDTTAPTMTIAPVSGGFVNAAEDDAPVPISASYSSDIESITLTISDTDAQTADVVKRSAPVSVTLGRKIAHGTDGLILTSGANFGDAVATDGTKIYVGADQINSGGGAASGAVFVFEDKNSDGDFADTGELTQIGHSTAGLSLPAYGNFGHAVAVSDGVLYVGAVADDTGGTNRGALYILDDKNSDGDFADTGENTKIDSTFTGLSLADADSFGTAAAVSGNKLFVGALRSDNGGTDRGAVYVFTDTDNDGSFTDAGGHSITKIGDNTDGITVPDNGYFGEAIAVSDGVLYVSATGVQHNGQNSGRLYILEDKNGDGDYADAGENVMIDATTPGVSIEAFGWFGRSLLVNGPRLFIGSSAANTYPLTGSDEGEIFVLEDVNGDGRYDGDGEFIVFTTNDLDRRVVQGDQMGTSLALFGSALLTGAIGDDGTGFNSGALYFLPLSFSAALSATEVQSLTEGTVTVTGSIADAAGNTGTGTASFIYDTTAPTVSAPTVSDSNGVFSVSTTDGDTATTVMRYKLIVDGVTCGASAMESATTAYTEGATLSFSDAEASGKRVCFSSSDSAGNTGYAQSTVLTITALTGTVGPVVPSGSAREKRVTLSAVTDGASAEHKLISNATCNATNYGAGAGTTLTLTSGSGTVTLTNTTDNTKYLCFKLTKDSSADAYLGSAQITGIDDTMPSFSPMDGAVTNSATGDIVVSFSGAVFADSSGTAFTDTTVDGVISLHNNSSAGTTIGFDATVDNTANTITVNPTNTLSDGAVYIGLSNGWYYGSESTKAQGSAHSALFTVDTTAPTVSVLPVSGGYVNDDESDTDVGVYASVDDSASVSFTITDSTSYAVTRATSSVSAYMRAGGFSGSVTSARFGAGMAERGSKRFVGSVYDSTGGESRGALYILEDTNSDGDYGDTGESVKLDSTTTGLTLTDGARFGASVAAPANGAATEVLYVGAPGHGSLGAGAVFLFEDKNNDDDYADSGEVVTIDDSIFTGTLETADGFGTAVAVSGDVLYVGAPGDDTGGLDRGAVYILEDKNDDGDYLESGETTVITNTTLAGITLGASAHFGTALFADGDALYVGVPGYDGGGSNGKGAVIILEDKNDDGDFADDNDSFVLSASLLNPPLVYSTLFGSALFVSGDRLFVGAPGYDGDGMNRGAVYVLEDGNNDGDYLESGEVMLLRGGTAGLTLDDNDLFGSSVSFSSDGLSVGAPGDDTGGTDRGTVHTLDGLYMIVLSPFDLDDFAEGTVTVSATVTDAAGNSATANGSFVLDTTAPALDVPGAVGASDEPTVAASDDDSATVGMRYKLVDDGVECNAATMASGTTAYTESSDLSFTDTSVNGKRVCFSSEDAAGNVGYGLSGAITVSGTLSATVGSPSPSGAAKEKTIALSNVTSGASVTYKYISSSTCNATNYGTGGSAVTITAGAGSVTAAAEGSNNLYACFKLSKGGFQTVYVGSSQITGIDRTAPFAPTSLAFSSADDSGSSDSDRITNVVDDLTFIGCAEEGSQVQLYTVAYGPIYTKLGDPRGAGATDTTLCPLPGTKKFSVSVDLMGSTSSYIIAARTADSAGNESAVSGTVEIIVDSFAPTVSTPTIGGTGEEATVSTSDNDPKVTAMRWKLLSAGVDCNAFGMSGGGSSTYTEGEILRFNDISDSGKRVCFSSEDTAGNVGYAASAALSITPPLSITVNTPDTTAAPYKTVTVSSVSAGTDVYYTSLSSGSCDAATFATGGTEVTIAAGSGSVVLSQDSDNGSFLCFRAEKTGYATKYAASGTINGIDASDPTVTVAYRNQPTGGSALTSVPPGSDIYTVMSFSEPVRKVAADDTTARPVLYYQAKNAGSVTVAEAQYDIILSGSLASGDCMADRTGRIYTCRYTLASTAAAGTEFKSYAGSFTDTAGNDGAVQTFDTNTGKVSVALNTEPTIFFHPQISGYTNRANTNVQLSFSDSFYKDSAGASFANTDLANILTLKQTNATGTDIPYTATVSGTTMILTPDSPLSDGVVYVGISNSWYYGSAGTKSQGTAQSGSFTVDTVAPTGTINTIAGDDYVSGTEDDAPITITGRVPDDDVPFVGLLIVGTGANPFILPRPMLFLTDNLWSTTLTPAEIQQFSPGQILVTANVSDRAGNPAALPVMREFTYLPFVPPNGVGDTEPPTRGGGGSGSGSGDGGSGSGTQEYTFSGRTDPVNPVNINDSVRLFDNGELIGQYTFTEPFPNGSAPWTITVTLPRGIHNFTIRFYDAAGNPSSGEQSTGTIDNRDTGKKKRRGGGGGGIRSVFGQPRTSPTNPAVGGMPLTDDMIVAMHASPDPLDDLTQPDPTLTLGDESPIVKRAQQLLNHTICPVAIFGPGSPGQETNYLGPLTRAALFCYQKTKGLPPTSDLDNPTYRSLIQTVVRHGSATYTYAELRAALLARIEQIRQLLITLLRQKIADLRLRIQALIEKEAREAAQLPTTIQPPNTEPQ